MCDRRSCRKVFIQDGDVSDINIGDTDSDDCFQCPENQYPNVDRNRCLQKDISFLSFEEPLGIMFTVFGLLFSFLTALLMYGSAPATNKHKLDGFYHQMFPNMDFQYKGILQLLKHFMWTWIGVLCVNNDNGEKFVQNVIPMFSKSGICFDFIERFPLISYSTDILTMVKEGMKMYSIVMNSTVNSVLIQGEIDIMIVLRMLPAMSKYEEMPLQGNSKIWIMTAQMDFTSLPFQRLEDLDFLHGALSFAVHSSEALGFREFLQMRKPNLIQKDGFIRVFWKEAFGCVFSDSIVDEKHNSMMENQPICSGEEKLETLPTSVFEMDMTGHSYSIYNAVYILAHAIRVVHSTTFKYRARISKLRLIDFLKLHPWKLNEIVRSISFNNTKGETLSFNQNGELDAGFDVINWVTFPNKSFLKVKVGGIGSMTSQEDMVMVHEEAIIWPIRFNQVRPSSLCNNYCSLGYAKTKIEGKPFCCYDCLHCPQGKISNLIDMDDCFTCPEDQYPNKDQNSCLPKTLTFLTYEESLGTILVICSLLSSFIVLLVLGVFIKYQDTPIVKANNRNLTYIFLISLLLSFLCALLFIGKPHKVTCLLRQSTFGIIFSVAVSCMLAKTTIVILAFMATKPNSIVRKWVGKRLGISIVFFCSFIQIILCTVWLFTFPPFPDFNVHLMAKEIILECNEGSFIMFYCVLGFMGLLALVSFTLAFFARKLPDTFNEAKFITFSMLIFCSVWLSFVPSYLTTGGKHMVTVEIFSIITSSGGLLICIFFPKCYIIILRPELNNKQPLKQRKK
ncbi:vomeronasal type-2 receptor 26-like [Protobothrops mucrosquamatus]|uniref:vomeronasal type-2 receptor 26-like n=1 Tax=Protobothrops mucrosquamatus TaxID=103944 RepID=UPI0010FB0556|nr:vomeronasal type-2 receptor 26-like [Protobothrops mucrosquamatus]